MFASDGGSGSAGPVIGSGSAGPVLGSADVDGDFFGNGADDHAQRGDGADEWGIADGAAGSPRIADPDPDGDVARSAAASGLCGIAVRETADGASASIFGDHEVLAAGIARASGLLGAGTGRRLERHAQAQKAVRVAPRGLGPRRGAAMQMRLRPRPGAIDRARAVQGRE